MKLFAKLLGRLVFIIILLSIGLTLFSLLTGDAPTITDIKGGYGLVKESSRSAYIAHRDTPDTPVIDSIVISYAVSGNIIAVKQAAVPAEDAKPDFTTYTYWLLDTATGEVFGPLADEAAFNEQSSQLDADKFDKWLGT